MEIISCDHTLPDDADGIGNSANPYPPTDAQLASFFKNVAGLTTGGSTKDLNLNTFVDSGLINPLMLEIDDEIVRVNPKSLLLPPSLRQLTNFRRGSKVRRERISVEIVQNPPHPWIQEVYDGWLSGHQELVHVCSEGPLFATSPIAECFVASEPSQAAQQLAATIWALGFTDDISWQEVLKGLQIINERGNVLTSSKLAIKTVSPKQTTKQQVRESKAVSDLRISERSRKQALDRVISLETQLGSAKEEAKNAKKSAATNLKETQAKANSESKLSNRLKKVSDEMGTAERRISELITRLENAEKRVSRITFEYEQEREIHLETNKRLVAVETELGQSRSKFEELPKGLQAVHTNLLAEIEDVELRKNTTEGDTKRQLDIQLASLKLISKEFAKIYPQFDKPASPRPNNTKKAEVRFDSLGGGNEIGASCYLLGIGSSEVLIDAGIRMNHEIDKMGPDLSRWDNDDPSFHSVVLTHAHSDHSAWLPALVAKWINLDIYCTEETKQLLGVMLYDSFKNLQRQLKITTERAQFTGEAIPDLPYNEEHIATVLRNILTIPFNQSHSFGPDLRFTFLPAGHILGAASVLFEGSGRRVLVSGDYSTFDQRTVTSNNWSEAKNGTVDLVVSESTYGHCRELDRADLEDSLIQEVKDVTSRGGTALIPCFALGRAQEVITILDLAFKSGELNECRVWVDGMIDDINPVYHKYDKYSVGENIVERRRSGETIEEVIAWSNLHPTVIVTTSGMMSGGPVVEYAKVLLENGKNRVLLCGYQDEESPGRQLLRLFETDASRRKLRIFNDEGGFTEINVRSRAGKFQLSAHSDLGEMVEAIADLHPEHVVLVHGEPDQQMNLSGALLAKGISVAEGPKIVIPAE